MNSAASFEPPFRHTTASGVASAGQVMDRTPLRMFRDDMTASPKILFVLYREPPAPLSPQTTPLTAAEYPVLAKIWDNDEDEIFNTL